MHTIDHMYVVRLYGVVLKPESLWLVSAATWCQHYTADIEQFSEKKNSGRKGSFANKNLTLEVRKRFLHSYIGYFLCYVIVIDGQ